MTSIQHTALGLILLSASFLKAEEIDFSVLSLKAHLLASEELSVSGEFSQYDFSGVDSAFDWTFTTPNGTVYQLQGKAPSANDVFGWKQVTVTPSNAAWYMSYLGDWDNDGESKFDWVLMGNGTNAVYKLAGVTQSGNFAYSSKIDVPYTVSGDTTKISFGDANTPQLSVTYPTSGGIIAKVEQNNGSGYAHYYGTSMDNITKIVGDTGDGTFEIIFSNDKISSYTLGNNKITYNHNSDGTADLTFYVNNVLQAESSNVPVRATLTKAQYEALMAEAGGQLHIAAIILRDKAVDAFFRGICDRGDARYNPDLCTKLFEEAYHFIKHVNFEVKSDLEAVAQSSTNASPTDDPEGVVIIDIVGFYATLAAQFNGFYSDYNICPATYSEGTSLHFTEPVNTYCNYSNGQLSSISANGMEAEDSTSRFNATLSNGEIRMVYSNNSMQLDGTKAANNAYRYFALYTGPWASRIPDYSTMINIITSPDYIYTYTEYKNGIRNYKATYEYNGEIIRFCKYKDDGNLYDWCEPAY